MLFLPKILLLASLAVLVIAIAGPHMLILSKTTKIVESRTRVDLIDVSGSMAWRFENGVDRSKAEIARRVHLNFLEKRRGKYDRVSLWIFSETPHLIEDFIVDDELYSVQVSTAPWLLKNIDKIENVSEIDPSKILDIGESGTDLDQTLREISRQVVADRQERGVLYGANSGSKTALLMVTDARANSYPERGLEMLREARIIPYIIFLKTSEDSLVDSFNNYQQDYENSQRLLAEIGKYGGRYFDAASEKDLQDVYKEIDRLESARLKVVHVSGKAPIQKLFLALATICFSCALAVGIFVELILGQRT